MQQERRQTMLRHADAVDVVTNQEVNNEEEKEKMLCGVGRRIEHILRVFYFLMAK